MSFTAHMSVLPIYPLPKCRLAKVTLLIFHIIKNQLLLTLRLGLTNHKCQINKVANIDKEFTIPINYLLYWGSERIWQNLMVIIKEKLPEVRKFCSIWTSCLIKSYLAKNAKNYDFFRLSSAKICR